MTCLDPCYHIQYTDEQLYDKNLKIKQGFSLIYGTNQNLTTLTEDSRATLVFINSNEYSNCGKVFRGLSN